MNISHDLHYNQDTDNDRTHDVTADTSTEHHVHLYHLTIFDQEIFLSLQNIHFCSNVIKFVLGIIPKFKNFIAEMKYNHMDETPSSLRW